MPQKAALFYRDGEKCGLIGHRTRITARLRGSFRGPEGTGLLTPRGLLIRDLEIFGPRFWGPEGTIGVPFGTWSVSLETESFRPGQEST
jgi:hypothetical protein